MSYLQNRIDELVAMRDQAKGLVDALQSEINRLDLAIADAQRGKDYFAKKRKRLSEALFLAVARALRPDKAKSYVDARQGEIARLSCAIARAEKHRFDLVKKLDDAKASHSMADNYLKAIGR